MKLPHLTQRIFLAWGEAGLVAAAIEGVLCRQLEPPTRPTVTMVLSFGPLYRVRARLLARAQRERYHVGLPPKKPGRFALTYDELAALMLVLPQAQAAGGAWGEVQRVSLNLEQVIAFGA